MGLMPRFNDREKLSRLTRRLDWTGSGSGLSFASEPRAHIGPLGYWPRVGRVVAHHGDGLYQIAEIDETGQDHPAKLDGDSGFFHAFELNGLTTVEADTRVVCIPVADGRKFIFFRGSRLIPLASAAANYCYLQEDAAGVAHGSAFDVYYDAAVAAVDEKRGLIHNDNIVGVDRTMYHIVMDIACGTSWTYGTTVSSPNINPATVNAQMELIVEIRPVLIDFDPATATWNWAYVTAGGAFTGNLGVAATITVHFNNTLDLTVTPGGAAGASAIVSVTANWDAFMPVKLHEGVLATWNTYAAIYGWEWRITFGGVANQAARFLGGALTSNASVCYAIAA